MSHASFEMTLSSRRHGESTLCAFAFATLTALASHPLAAQARPAPARFDTAAILASARPEIAAANAAWLSGLRNRDAAAIAAPYADRGLFITAHGAVVRGRSAIAKMYAARFPGQREIRSGSVVQDGISVAGPRLVYEWGHAWLEMSPSAAGGPPVRTPAPP